MNKAESAEIGDFLDSLGMQRVTAVMEADIVVLNTCVVRQNAEDKVLGMLGYLKGIKPGHNGMRIALTGCFVTADLPGLRRAYPHVDLFFQPGEINQFQEWMLHEYISVERRQDSKMAFPVNAYISITQGCNNFCSYCIVPYRRGKERSYSPEKIVARAQELAAGGTREITLVGQNVNAYGKDLGDKTNLGQLLRIIHEIDDIKRIRFLTNHPKDMDTDLIKAISELPKVCHHLCLPLQAGDDLILRAMNRHYTVNDYKDLVRHIRSAVPDIALSTDIIVGFPGESEEQFLNTYRAIKEIQFTAVHVAAYSPRAGTLASRIYKDDVLADEKLWRLHAIEDLQRNILAEENESLVNTDVEVLVEGQKGGKWYGRTYSDKLVFFPGSGDLKGQTVNVRLTAASPWALRGNVSPDYVSAPGTPTRP